MSLYDYSCLSSQANWASALGELHYQFRASANIANMYKKLTEITEVNRGVLVSYTFEEIIIL
jgi:hypothetical protein